jgi:hypothetical protein
VLASLEATSDQPVSVIASRITTNQQGDFMVSNSPVADLSIPISGGPVLFPQIVDGGGYQATIVMMNTSNAQETGTLRFYDNNGGDLSVHMIGDASFHSQYAYSIAPGGFLRLVTDGSPANANVGWAQLVPEAGSFAPAASAILGSTQRGVFVTEAAFPAVVATTHAHVYVDMSNGHDTGIAISNPSASPIRISAAAFRPDGLNRAGNTSFLDVPAMGHDARFAREFINGLPAGFTGVLDITSSAPFAAMTVRSLMNSAGNFLTTIFSVADINASPPSPVIFPQIADGGGYQTEIILLSKEGADSTVTVRYMDNNGAPLNIGK